jgi:hypothetical protein
VKEKIVEVTLRKVYNELWKRRNQQFTQYDVFYTPRHNAQFNFKILAKKLIEAKIDPKFYLLVLSNYGRWSNATTLPPPHFLASDKAIQVFGWLSKKEQEKYFTKTQLKEGLAQGVEIHSHEVLGRIQEDAKTIARLEVENRIKKKDRLNLLFGTCTLVSSWYLALQTKFIGNFFESLDKPQRNEVRKCRAYFKSHLSVKERAFEVIRLERQKALRVVERKQEKKDLVQKLIVSRFMKSLYRREA